jgi:hypothetical protein
MDMTGSSDRKEFTDVLKSFQSKLCCIKKDKCCKNFKEGKRCKKCPKR